MNIDDLDLMIMIFFLEYNGKTHTSCDVAKSFYSPETDAELRKYSTRIDYRLKKWVDRGVFIKEIRAEGKRKIAYYTINLGGIYYGETELKVLEKTINTGDAIVLELKDGRYIVAFKDSI